ncbi:MAG: iron ABC transporter permease [archaeon]|nr:iron ABC transporter permease [archaeon]
MSSNKEAPVSTDMDVENVIHTYNKARLKKIIGLIVYLAILVVAAGIGMGIGSYDISFGRVYEVIFKHLLNWGAGMTSLDMNIVWNDRMPRLLCAIAIGVGLGAAGAAMQSMMKNPLADPYTTGISSGAGFGAVLAICTGFALIPGQYGIVINAFIFSLVPAAVILVLSTFKKASASMIILAGIAVMYIFNALQSYMMVISDETTTATAYEWSVGTLNKASWDNFFIMAAFAFIGAAVLTILAKYLNAMNSGDNYAKTLGINVEKMRIMILVVISLVAAGIVSFTGIIGFVGLVGPHMARIIIGSDNKFLIPGSMLTGATLMVVCDILAKLFTPTPVHIGIVTALFGGPLFLFLIMRQRKDSW